MTGIEETEEEEAEAGLAVVQEAAVDHVAIKEETEEEDARIARQTVAETEDIRSQDHHQDQSRETETVIAKEKETETENHDQEADLVPALNQARNPEITQNRKAHQVQESLKIERNLNQSRKTMKTTSKK